MARDPCGQDRGTTVPPSPPAKMYQTPGSQLPDDERRRGADRDRKQPALRFQRPEQDHQEDGGEGEVESVALGMSDHAADQRTQVVQNSHEI